MADWNEWSSPKPKGCGSNPVIDNLEYNNILWVEKKLIKIVGSPGLMVKGGDSYLESRELESRRRILDGHS